MSEAMSDQPAPVEDTSATGVATEAVAAPADDIDTEAFDRMPAPEGDEDDTNAPTGEGGDPNPEDKPAGEADEIEVEVGGQKLRVPKAVEPLLLMQSDYTKKTQALAEQTRQVTEQASTLEAQRAQQVESLKAFRDEHMAVARGEQTLAEIATELAEFGRATQADWVQLQNADPARYDAARQRFELLRLTRSTTEEALEAARKDLTTKEAKLSESQQATRSTQLAKAWEETHATLEREVKDWTPDRFKAVAQFAATQLGYKPEELREAADPRAWKMATKIMDLTAEVGKLQTALKQKTTADNNARAQTVTPAERPRGSTQPRGVSDTMSDAEWMRRREQQVARKRA